MLKTNNFDNLSRFLSGFFWVQNEGFSRFLDNLFFMGLSVKYKRSAGFEAFHFQFADMFVNIQFVQI